MAVHQDEGGWVAKATWHDETVLDGHLVEWEWLDVRQTAALLSSQDDAPSGLGTQNAYRVLGAYVTSLLRQPLGTFYRAALAAHLAAWCVACAAVFGLARLAALPNHASAGTAAVVAAGLTATAPGFIGYLGQVDPHPYAYAAAAAWLLLLERLWHAPVPPAVAPPRYWARPILAGLALCLAGYSMEIAYPLLLIMWLMYGGRALFAQCQARSSAETSDAPHLLRRIGWLATATGAFLLPYVAYRILVERALGLHVVAVNEPFTQLSGNLASIADGGLIPWAQSRIAGVAARWLVAFPVPVAVLAIVGMAVINRRWLGWAVAVVAVFTTAIALTKPTVRELYLVYPAVYVLAAHGAVRIGGWAAGSIAPAPIAGPPHARRARAAALIALVAVQLGIVLAATNADLWGDYWLPFGWYRIQ